MSLIHWWPLTGDTQDKMTGVVSTSSGTTIVNGKIGQAYSFDGVTGTTISAPYKQTINSNKFSFGFWIKLNSNWTGWGQVFTVGIVGTSWTHIRIGIDINNEKIAFFSVSDGTNYVGTSGPSHTLTTDVWYHIFCTYDNGLMTMYVNGAPATRKATYSPSFGPKLNDAAVISIGGNGSEVGECIINDVRIYNNVLSQSEIYDLSKGLMLHYNFDDWYGESTINLLPLEQQTQSNTAGTITITEGLVNGGTYTLSTYITRQPSCTATNPRLTLRFFYSDGTDKAYLKYNDGGASYPKDGIERYYYITATADPTKTLTGVGGWLMDHSSGTGKQITATRSQLELKDHPTPYAPTNRVGRIADCSGLNRNGVIYGNINLTQEGNYGTYTLTNTGSAESLVMENTSCIIGDLGSEFTPEAFSLFFSGNVREFGAQGSGLFCLSNASTRPTDYLNSTLRQYDWNFRINNVADDTQATISYDLIIPGEWHHYAIVWDGSTLYGYRDGKLINSKEANFTPNSFRYVFLGLDFAGGMGRNATVSWSNFKLYSTAFTTSEVKSIFEGKGYVTNTNSIQSGEFVEGAEKVECVSNYVFEAKEINEDLYEDYELLEYIQSSGTQYIDTGYVNTSSDYTYELDMAWTGTDVSRFESFIGFMHSSTIPRAALHKYSGSLMFGGDATTNATEVIPVANERFWYKGKFKSGDQKLYKNNELIAQNSNSFNHSDNTLSVYIFGRNNSGKNLSYMRLYEANIYEGDTLVRHYIPMRRKSDGALGLYEEKQKEFFINQGTSTFVPGETITSNYSLIHSNGNCSSNEFIEF